MTCEALSDMQNLCDRLTRELPDITAELTDFPSGSAMLDLRRAGRSFVMSYSPATGFGVDEVLPDEGFLTNCQFCFTQFEPAAQKLCNLVLTDHTEPSAPGLSLVVLRSADIHLAKDFYTVLGLNFVEERHGEGPLHFSAMAGSTVVEIYPCRQDESPTPVRLGFRVQSVDQTVKELARKGASIVREPKDSVWGRRALVEDPDRNRIELN